MIQMDAAAAVCVCTSVPFCGVLFSEVMQWKATRQTVIYIMVLLFLNDAKSTLKSLYCCFFLNDGILYPATITCQSERNKKQPQLFTLIHVAVLLYDLSSITSIV